MKSDNIAIVGGGSAGWMTAAILIKSFPEKNITLIESPRIPKIGVGESTYDGINYYLEYLGIDRESFFSETDASIKLGLEFVNFYKNEGESFIYPFGLAYTEETLWGMQDWMVRKYCYPETPNTDFAESYFPVSFMIKHNTFNENADRSLPNFNPKLHTALHFDALKFSLWLRDRYCIPRGVKHILSEVSEVSVDKKNKKIDYIRLEDGSSVKADLYIDCTGFKSLLLEGAMEEPFISYNNILPNNRAWATQIPYQNKDLELETTTRCTAIESGWVWNIPLYSRIGAGYVYSDRHTSKEKALDEFKKYLCSDLMKVPRSEEEVNNFQFKDIEMKVGIHENIWVGNVVAIGLSAGFIEPLESNGLFTVHDFLFELVRSLSRDSVSSWDIHSFNEKTRYIFEGFVEFIKLHYALSIRDDTEYWADNMKAAYSFDRLSAKNIEAATLFQMFEQKTKTYEPHPNGGFLTGAACISTGMDYRILDSISSRIGELKYGVEYKDVLDEYFDRLDQKKNSWESVAKNSPSLKEYLSKKYYGE
jgi:tryptophan halogenase